jgi:hypothetical protein
MKKIPFRQTTQFGCGSYTLANLFNEKEFIAKLPTEDGEALVDLNKKLSEGGLSIYPLFLTKLEFRVGNRFDKANVSFFSDKMEGMDSGLVPYLISFARPSGALHYLGLIRNLATGKWYVVDSCEEEVFEVEILWFIKNYHIISVSLLFSDRHNQFVAFVPEESGHLI